MPQLPPKALKAYAKNGDKNQQQKFPPKKQGEPSPPPPHGKDKNGDKGKNGNGGGKGGGDNGNGNGETMFSDLEDKFPEVAEMLEDLADAHESKDDKAVESAVGKLVEFLSGKGLKKHGGGDNGDEKNGDNGNGGGDNGDDEDDADDDE